MAPERTPGPGGSSLPGMPRSAPATVARSSADLVPQSPNSASLGGDDGPSREEVQQRISSSTTGPRPPPGTTTRPAR
ncbi:hypothetical protein ACFQ51_05635 [Streptomyces kaempferi]